MQDALAQCYYHSTLNICDSTGGQYVTIPVVEARCAVCTNIQLTSFQASIFAGRRDPTKERLAPPLPTTVTFPSLCTLREAKSAVVNDETSISNIQKRISGIRKPSDLTVDLLHSLNVNFTTDEPLDDWVPSGHLPPQSWIESANEYTGDPQGSSSRRLYSGREAPGRKEFSIRVKEVLVSNDVGYGMLAGRIKPDANTPRLAHLRRFWEGLDGMASYWDTSLDEYIPRKPEETSEQQATPELKGVTKKASIQSSEPRKRTKTDGTTSPSISSSNPPSVPGRERPPGTYRGHRMSNGADMPEMLRSDTIRPLVEACAWPFGLTVTPPRRPPLLAMGNIRVPVKLAYSVWRVPKEREKAQGRWLEGPMLGVSCRNETNFTTDNVESIVDTVSEIAALLLLAQERAREGKQESKPGEGKWWTERPRWGGGPGGEIGDAAGSKDGPVDVTKGKPGGDDTDTAIGQLMLLARKGAKKSTGADAWKLLKPGFGYWDPKAVYEPIGKAKGSPFDEVWLPPQHQFLQV